MFEPFDVMECLGHFKGIVPSLVCILTKQHGTHGGKYLLKTPGNVISDTLNFKVPCQPLAAGHCSQKKSLEPQESRPFLFLKKAVICLNCRYLRLLDLYRHHFILSDLTGNQIYVAKMSMLVTRCSMLLMLWSIHTLCLLHN